jgi:hypothetical protein
MASYPDPTSKPAKEDGGDEVSLTVNPLIEMIDPQPDDQRSFTIMIGYIGEVTDTNVRVYPKLDLRHYVNIPKDGIKAVEKVFPDQETSPSKIVIDASAKVDLVRNIEAGFLFGPIVDVNLGLAGAGAGAGVGLKRRPGGPATIDPCGPIPDGGGLPPSTCNHPHACASDAIKYDLY